MEMRKQQDAIAKERRGQVGSGERSEKIRTYNFKENRITDHRINFTIHQLEAALDGDLGALVAELEARWQSDKLRLATEQDPNATPES
jgi:peptide chain release factor 1